MAVDFPNNPAVDELFFAEGTVWKWTGAAWAVVGSGGTPVEIVEADMAAKWQVWGDTLIQWGNVAANASGDVTVLMPKAYKNGVYSVLVNTVNGYPNPSTNATVISGSAGVSQFQVKVRNFAGAGVANEVIFWYTVGEAPDALKKPKVVQTIGGADVKEYLDPTGVGSWRLVGENLEMWGTTAPGLSQGLLTFPKRFKPGTTPTFNCSVAATSPQLKVVNYNGVEGGITDPYRQLFVYVRDGAGSTTGQVSWHARGIWDGVS